MTFCEPSTSIVVAWLDHILSVYLITGSNVRSATRRYLISSEADFELFCPAGATRCTNLGEISRGGGDWSPRQISPQSVQRLGYRSPKTEIFLLRFGQNVDKRPAGAYLLRNFPKICRVCTPFQYALAVKISLDLLKGLRSYGGFKLTRFGCPQIFSAP